MAATIFLTYLAGIAAVFLCMIIRAIWMFDVDVKISYGHAAPWETFMGRVGFGFVVSMGWPLSLLFIAVRTTKKIVKGETDA